LNWIAAGFSDEVVSYLPMLAAAAALSSIREIGVEGPGIKWPNDILVNGRKLAGLLIHARRAEITMVTVGLGVNLRPVGSLPNHPIQPPVSLDEIFGVETATEVAVDLVVAFVRGLVGFAADPAPALVLWREGLIHRQGDSLTVRLASGEELTGLFAGLTDEGFLRLQQDDDVRIITGGDIIES
jgi:BirA family biotin operon repressor/biotin-[acetyl-CoA-carboxylase] ligase